MQTGVAYFGNRMPKHVTADLADIAEHGCTFVVHTLSENDWKFYHRTLGEIFELTHRAGLETWVDPWGVGHVFGGEAFSLWVAENPELCQRDAEGRQVPAACLNQPPFRQFLHAWVDAALALNPNMVFWDEPHLFVGAWRGESERWSCLCDVCRDLYRQRNGEPMPTARADAGVQAFRAWTVLDFLSDAVGFAHSQGARNALCLYPEEVLPDLGPAWSDIAQIPGLDNLGTDPYPFLPPDRSAAGSPPVTSANRGTNLYPFRLQFGQWADFIESNARKIVRVTREYGVDNHFWIQAFGIPADDTGYVQGAIRLAVEAGITNIATWGYDACAHMSWITCEQPTAVWETIGREFRRLRGETRR